MKFLDQHAIFGFSGAIATITISQINTVIGCLVGLATLTYMSFKAAREYIKWRRDEERYKDEI